MVLWLYFKAVGKHWWALMSCAAFTVLGLYVAHANKGNAWVVDSIFSLAAVLLFVACFLAWHDEHKRLLIEQKKNEGSRVEGQIHLVLADSKNGAEDGSGFEVLKSGCYLSACITATNVNPALAYLNRNATVFSIEVDKKTHYGKYVPLQSGRIDFMAINAGLMNGNIFDFFSATFGGFPMQDGEPRFGWLRFFFSDIDESTLQKAATVSRDLKITLLDSRQKPHEISGNLQIQFGVLYRTEIKRGT